MEDRNYNIELDMIDELSHVIDLDNRLKTEDQETLDNISNSDFHILPLDERYRQRYMNKMVYDKDVH